MALSRNIKVDIAYQQTHLVDMPALTNQEFFVGSAVADISGNGYAGIQTGTNAFLGFCLDYLDMTGVSSGTRRIQVVTQGVIKNVSVASSNGVTDLGVDVYMSDDNTFTLSSSGTAKVGKVANYNADTGLFDIAFKGATNKVS